MKDPIHSIPIHSIKFCEQSKKPLSEMETPTYLFRNVLYENGSILRGHKSSDNCCLFCYHIKY